MGIAVVTPGSTPSFPHCEAAVVIASPGEPTSTLQGPVRESQASASRYMTSSRSEGLVIGDQPALRTGLLSLEMDTETWSPSQFEIVTIDGKEKISDKLLNQTDSETTVSDLSSAESICLFYCLTQSELGFVLRATEKPCNVAVGEGTFSAPKSKPERMSKAGPHNSYLRL